MIIMWLKKVLLVSATFWKLLLRFPDKEIQNLEKKKAKNFTEVSDNKFN